MKAQTKETQAMMNPKKALQALKDGNTRFQKNKEIKRDLLDQVKDTVKGQYPFATVLGCIDSRVPAELVFDQGIGDIFNIRIAGNFVNKDILGSMEFACKLAGTKLILVLGHTACGAVKGACDDAKLGNLTGMLDKIKPAVQSIKVPENPTLRTSANAAFVNDVASKNVELTIANIRELSPVLAEMETAGEITIKGAMYNIENGEVSFFD